MSSLQNNYDQVANGGVPTGVIVSAKEYTITSDAKMMASVVLNGGTATMEIDNGGGFITIEPMISGVNNYDLKPCKFKITLLGGATASTS